MLARILRYFSAPFYYYFSIPYHAVKFHFASNSVASNFEIQTDVRCFLCSRKTTSVNHSQSEFEIPRSSCRTESRGQKFVTLKSKRYEPVLERLEGFNITSSARKISFPQMKSGWYLFHQRVRHMTKQHGSKKTNNFAGAWSIVPFEGTKNSFFIWLPYCCSIACYVLLPTNPIRKSEHELYSRVRIILGEGELKRSRKKEVFQRNKQHVQTAAPAGSKAKTKITASG